MCILELFAAASEYIVEDLKCICEKILLNNIDQDNALDTLRIGNFYESFALKQNAFEEICCKIFPNEKLPENLMNRFEQVTQLIEPKNLMDREKKRAEEKYEIVLEKWRTN